jgi:hypothetical protein
LPRHLRDPQQIVLCAGLIHRFLRALTRIYSSLSLEQASYWNANHAIGN